MIFLSLLGLLAIQPEGAVGAGAGKVAAAPPQVTPAVTPWSSQFDLRSEAVGRTFRIFVSHPSGPAPKAGWPVIYVLDGNIIFGTVASQNILKAKYEGVGALIVGVGYPDADSAFVMRNHDLTPSAPTAAGSRIGMLGTVKPGEYGGGAAFRRFISTELKAAIAAQFPVDRSNQTLMGYSYGGLFTLGMLFDDPGAYRTYVIGSPSIWWNEREILAKEAGFTRIVRSGAAAPRILITSDGLEQDTGALKLPEDARQRALIVAAVGEERMVDNAKELAQRLQAIPGKPGYHVEYVLFDGETHLSGFPVAASRGYGFAMKP